MARKIFFSFHYERDAWRAGQVRNSNVLPSEDQAGFIDAVDWESIKKQGRQAIERWIAEQLKGTSVTAVLIGSETADREWVHHEIAESWNRGNGVVGIWIHNVKDAEKKTDTKGENPFDQFKLPDGKLLSDVCKTYDWDQEDGRDNLGTWADEAADLRAGYAKSDAVEKASKTAKAASLSARAAAILAGPSQPHTPTPSRSAAFAPRAPWCSKE